MIIMKSLKYILLIVSSILAFSACSDMANVDSNQTGTLSVTLTDAPFPIDIVSEANVTITKIDIRNKDSETDGTEEEEVDEESFTTLTETEQSFNLLDFQNGVKTSLVDLEIEAGTYDLVRLYVSEASVTLNDGTTYDLTVPSGAQTGIKVFINPNIEVAGGLSSELLLDFEVASSFIVQGDMNSPDGINGFTFKPTIKAVNTSTAGRIEGFVTDTSGNPLENAEVLVFTDSDTSQAFTESNGYYSIISLDAQTYTVEATTSDTETLTVPDVEITAANSTSLDLELTPLEN